MEKANITLYAVIEDPDLLMKAIRERFEGKSEGGVCEGGKIDITLQDGTHLFFSISHRKNKPDFITSHTIGMANFFSQAETPLIELKRNVLRQIGAFNCITGITFELDENEGRTDLILNRLFEIADDMNGFLLYPTMQLFTGGRQLLFSAKGESQLIDFIPTGYVGSPDEDCSEEAHGDVERRLRSIVLLEEKHIPYLEYLPAQVMERNVRLRSRKEMVQRAAALFAVAVYSELMLSEDSGREEALLYFNKMGQLYGVNSYMTPVEVAYINNPAPEEMECIQFGWRYECVGVLLWAAGVVGDLSYPSDIIDLPVLAAIFWQHKGVKDLLSKGFPRAQSEILDAADITLRYDWACVEAQKQGKEPPALLNKEVIMERHYAFNWIIGAYDGADWDMIETK